MPRTPSYPLRDATPAEVRRLVVTALHSRDPMRRAQAEAQLIDQELPVSAEAIVLAARRQRAAREMAGDV